MSAPSDIKLGTEASQQVIDRHRARLFPWVKPYYGQPLVMESAEGIWVRDVDGNEYLDLFAGILTTSIGHCHPEVQAAVTAQMARLGHTSALYVTEGQIEAADRLVAIAPSSVPITAFTNSGTEAVETAITAAQAFTGRTEVVALRHAYSGRSALAASITAQHTWRAVPSMTAGISHARSPNVFRSPLGPDASEAEHLEFFISDLVETIETTTSGRPAALIIEAIQGVGGFVVPPKGYLARAAEVIRSYGGVFICDEVQTGFGRTGGRWFGCQHDGVEPDLMIMAKGIANGFPVGATMARPDIAEAWTSLSVSTYGGNPVSMAATCATLDVMKREDVPARSSARGSQLREGLEQLAGEHRWMGDVRGKGLMQAIEVIDASEERRPDGPTARALQAAAREQGLLLGLGGLGGNVIRIGPSMLITESEMSEALDRLGRACAAVSTSR